MSKSNNNYPIDFVVMWVDGSDPKWLKRKKEYKSDLDIADITARYRDWGIFKYWFRAVEKYAPWVNHVFLVTDGQKPDWLNEENEKLTIIDHKEILRQENLPVYNASAIEINLHRIPNLSEHFVFFNDDMFLTNNTRPEDFFKNGIPVEIANINAATGMEGDQLFARILFNDILLINRHFDKKAVIKKHPLKWINIKYGSYNIRTLSQMIYPYFTGYKPHHMPAPTMTEVWDVEKETMTATSSHRFRHNDDVNQYVFIEWQLCKNNFVPRKKSDGRYIRMNVDNIDSVKNVVLSKKYKYICINDGVSDDIKRSVYTNLRNELIKSFESKLSRPSSFENGKK